MDEFSLQLAKQYFNKMNKSEKKELLHSFLDKLSPEEKKEVLELILSEFKEDEKMVEFIKGFLERVE